MKLFFQKTYLFLIYILLYFPILILVLYSMNNATFSLQWGHFSFSWYQELFSDRGLWEAFRHSIFLGFCAAIMATILSFFVCIQLFLFKKNHRHTVYTSLLLLLIIPDLVFGVALLIFFNIIGISLGFFSLLIAHITFCIPFAVMTLTGHFSTIDPNIYFSALDLGASRRYTMAYILFPLLWPAILSSFLLSFTLSFDDVIISYFVAGPDYNILPLTIYSLVRTGVTPELNALCSCIFGISLFFVLVAHRLTGRAL